MEESFKNHVFAVLDKEVGPPALARVAPHLKKNPHLSLLHMDWGLFIVFVMLVTTGLQKFASITPEQHTRIVLDSIHRAEIGMNQLARYEISRDAYLRDLTRHFEEQEHSPRKARRMARDRFLEQLSQHSGSEDPQTMFVDWQRN
jgi:uncharacterized protein (DUF2267 family)